MKEARITGTIEHEGTVQKVGSDSVTVNIHPVSACSGCHADGYCSLSGRKEKTIRISGRYDVKPGEKVTVMMNESTGFRAVVLGYIVPLAVLVFSLAVLTAVSVNELTAGIISVAVLVPYFLILYLTRHRIERNFLFTLKK